ncbi:MAG: hypothetical protein ABF489_00365 [Bifidobacterium sp.]|uniref:hypothetical protein n=1 Tax=Bifidobacterium sp. TaxID=41200 RepID=UPI0039EC7ADA
MTHITSERAAMYLEMMERTLWKDINLDGVFCLKTFASDDYDRSYDIYQKNHRNTDKLLTVILIIDDTYFTVSIKHQDSIIFTDGGEIFDEYSFFDDYIDKLCKRVNELLLEYPLEDLPQADIDLIHEDIRTNTSLYGMRVSDEELRQRKLREVSREKEHQQVLAYYRTLPWYRQLLLFIQGKMF